MRIKSIKASSALFSVVAVMVFLSSCQVAGASDEENRIVVTADWLESKKSSNVLIIDARTKAAYDKGHLPGAISFPYRLTMNQNDAVEKVASLFEINSLFSERGITFDRDILIYGDGLDFRAEGHLLWVFELHGLSKVYILEGGLDQWVESGRALSQTPVMPTNSTFVGTYNPSVYADIEVINRAMYNDQSVIFDARVFKEYSGEEKKEGQPRAGHIPTAISLNSKETDHGKLCSLPSKEDTRQLYDSLGIKKDGRVILYCNSGVEAAVSYIRFRELGIPVSIYDGSWMEWSNHLTLPVVVGPKPGFVK